jgi:hypothetical protein
MPLYVTPPLSFMTYACCRGKCNEVERTTFYRLITDKKPVDRMRVRSESRRLPGARVNQDINQRSEAVKLHFFRW